MEIYLIRHTTPLVEQGICYGQTDLDIAHNFQEEVEDIKVALQHFNPDKVYTSPLMRCTKLAHSLFPKNAHEKEERIKELNFGDWEMEKWNAIDRKQLDPWANDFYRSSPPNGESFWELEQRSLSFWDEMLSKHINGDKIAVVSHSGVLRVLLMKYLEIPHHKIFNLSLDCGAIVHVNLKDNNATIKVIKG